MVTELSGKHDIYLGHEQRLKCFMVGFLLWTHTEAGYRISFIFCDTWIYNSKLARQP